MSPWTWESVWPAPAKLNLFLHVVGRRQDGYHCLQTVFRLVDHGDSLRFAPRDDGKIHLATPLPGVPPETDLTVRAARLLQQASVSRASGTARRGVSIHLEKRLPMGGGLGGGSSDAATVLLALNHLWELGLTRQQLQEIGLTLGADVPVFVQGKNAFAEGVGDVLTPLDLPARSYLVLEPPVQVPTADIFRAPGLRRDSPSMTLAEWFPGYGRNDLEPVATALFPVIKDSLAWLSRFSPARMTGSGACVFAEFDTLEAARSVHAQLPPDMRGWVAAGLAQHPLADL